VEQFRAFINGLDRWLAINHSKALNLFQTFDVNNTGRVSHDQLKAGMAVMCYIAKIVTGDFIHVCDYV